MQISRDAIHQVDPVNPFAVAGHNVLSPSGIFKDRAANTIHELTIANDRVGVSHTYHPTFASAVQGIMRRMNREDFRARIRRIEKLINGLGCEASLWRECSAPVLALDRLEYIAAIHRAITALEDARITLARMLRDAEQGPAGIA